MDKDVLCMYNRILSSYKKERNPAICNNTMNLEGIMLNEISQRKILYDLSNM